MTVHQRDCGIGSAVPAASGPAADARFWYIAQVKPGGLGRASQNLSRLGYDVFLPKRTETRRLGNRLVTELRPLFPGYLFVKVLPADSGWKRINSTYGVARLVCLERGRPTEVPRQIMSDLLSCCGGDGTMRNATDLGVGSEVRVVSGPFAGALARIEAVPEQDRVFLLFDMMSRKVRTLVASGDVELVTGASGLSPAARSA